MVIVETKALSQQKDPALNDTVGDKWRRMNPISSDSLSGGRRICINILQEKIMSSSYTARVYLENTRAFQRRIKVVPVSVEKESI